MKKNYIYIIFAVVLFVAIVFAGKYLIKPKYKTNEENPYDLNLEEIGKIPSEKMCNYKSKTIDLNIQKPKAIAIDKNDNIYISGDSSVLVLDKNGSKIKQFSTERMAYSLAISENNEIYVGEQNQLKKYSQTGELLGIVTVISDDAFITSIAISKEKIYLADAESEMVYIYKGKKRIGKIGTRDSGAITRFVLPSYYFDVAIDPDSTIWIANTGIHKLVNFREDGSMRSYWGKTSSYPEGFCGCCNPTHFAIMNDGSFITSEKGIVRVKKYSPAGEFVCAIASPDSFITGSTGLDIAIDSQQRIYVLEPKAKKIHIFYK